MGAIKAFAEGFWAACKLDWLPLSIFTAFVLAALGLLASKHINGFSPVSVLLNTRLFLTCIIFALSISFLWGLVNARPSSPIAFAKQFVREKLHWTMVARHAPIVIALCIFMPVFSAMKSAISLFATYSWDGIFTSWDRYIHNGDAWEMIHPLVGFPAATFILNLFYNFWIVVIYAGTVFFALRLQSPALRQRFLISYFACWTILGIVGAISLASVGPTFVEPLLGQHHFDPLTAYLNNANRYYPIFSLGVQEGLVERYYASDVGLGAGISAMPSMHVSKAFIFFLAMRHVSRAAAAALGLFVVIIMVSSVHLGYHYAIDGYVSIVLTLVIWTLSGWWVARPVNDNRLQAMGQLKRA